MHRTAYLRGVWTILLLSGGVLAQEFNETGLDERMPTTTARKSPGFRYRTAMSTPAEQYAHAERLRNQGKTRKALKAFRALVHNWHDSDYAPRAQLAYALLLERQKKYLEAFKEYQYLIDNFAGDFPYEVVLENQFRIAHHLMTTRQAKFWKFKGFKATERALPLFQELVENAPNWERSADAQFYIGIIHEGRKSYEKAVRAFEELYFQYPQHERTAEGLFHRAYCLYLIAGERAHDKRALREAVSALSQYTRRYPDSTHNLEVARYLSELKEELAGMYYDIAVYYDTTAVRPKAALIAYRDFVSRFPMVGTAEEARLRIKSLEEIVTQ